MMHAPRQSPSPRARESCSKPVMTHPRTSRRVSRRFTTGKTSRPQWATSLLGWHGPRTAGGRTEAYRSAAGSYRSVTGQGRTGMSRENRAQECHRAGMSRTGKHGEDRSSGVVFLRATPPGSKGVSGLDAGARHGSHWTPELRWTPGNPEPRRTHWTPGSPEPPRKAPGNPEPPGKQGIRVCPGSRDVGTIRGDEYSSPSGRDDRPASRSPSGVVHASGRAFPARVPRSS